MAYITGVIRLLLNRSELGVSLVSKMTFSITAFKIMTLSKHSTFKHSTTFNLTTLSMKGVFATLSHHVCECGIVLIVMLNVLMPSVVLLNVVMLNVVQIMLDVVTVNVVMLRVMAQSLGI
jgi:hypothetical protein